MENKQTAVEWLYEAIDDKIIAYLYGDINLNDLSIAMLEAKNQANEFEAKLMRQAYDKGFFDGLHRATGTFDQSPNTI
jgi:hypothetical protein